MSQRLTEPPILTANVRFRVPGATTENRRATERLHRNTVHEFLVALGFARLGYGDTYTGHGLTIKFVYEETATTVRKRLQIEKGERRSNILALRKILDAHNAEVDRKAGTR